MRSFLTLIVFGLLAIHVNTAIDLAEEEEELDREIALVEKALELVEAEKHIPPPPGPMKTFRQLSIVNKPTEQSSTYGTAYTSDKAVDGSSSSNMYPHEKCSSTAEGAADPWWRADLGEVHCITKVTILNRGDCCSDRLKNAVVRAGMSSTPTDNKICGSPVTASQAAVLGGTITFECNQKARYISVDIPGKAILQLCEVTVEEMLPCSD